MRQARVYCVRRPVAVFSEGELIKNCVVCPVITVSEQRATVDVINHAGCYLYALSFSTEACYSRLSAKMSITSYLNA